MNLHSAAAYRTDKFGHRPHEEVFGAMILAVRHLEWNISQVEGLTTWTIITGIPGAANNETITFRQSGDHFMMESHSTGDFAFHPKENEQNLKLLENQIISYLDSRTSTDLVGVYDSFLQYGVSVEDEWIGNSFRERARYLWEMITFKRPWVVTLGLMLLNLIVFVAMVIGGFGFFEMDGEKLLKWGGNYTFGIFQGEYWRLLTNVFMHGGIMHLVLNLFGLLIGGLVAENLMGKRRFLIAYLLCGIFASALSFYMHDEILSVGASGAIFGCFGIVLGLASTKLLKKDERTNLLIYFGVFVGLNLLNGVKSEIDNWAHIGGLICGWFGGFIWSFVLNRKENTRLRFALDLSIPVIVLVIVFALVKSKHNFFPEFENVLRRYDNAANAATVFYPGDANDAIEMQKYYDSSLVYFNKGNELLKEAQSISGLPQTRIKYVFKIMDANNARKELFYFVYQYRLHPGNPIYTDSLQKAETRFQTAQKMMKLE
ncbi:MAG: rhomboid family intramembrane serine protease [Bacteroidetes bacterium]|nr:rhomboid family intramembrane serine protease [Bacteroidota bacterium]